MSLYQFSHGRLDNLRFNVVQANVVLATGRQRSRRWEERGHGGADLFKHLFGNLGLISLDTPRSSHPTMTYLVTLPTTVVAAVAS